MKLLPTTAALLLQVILLFIPLCSGQGQDSSVPYLVGISPIVTFVHEDAEINHEIVDLHAYDPQGTLANYSLETDGPFDIDPDLGRIFVDGPLDRETVAAYVLVATVTDTEGLSGNITIDVTVLDVNDNPPRVENALNITLRELTEVGSRVHTIITSDPDIGDAGSVEFALVSNGDFVTDRSFSIARFSGDITLVQSLDHETVGQHILTVSIADLGTPALSTIVNITITVLDENDIAPIFTRSLYTARVPEGNTGVRVTRVQAVDADNLGALINYTIASGNIDDAFEIQSDGLIVTNNLLDREIRSRYILTVEAREASITSDAAVAFTTVVVEVEDVNDNPPTFLASLYTGFAREDATIGTNIITTVAAFDNDLGDNAAFRFRLSPQNSSNIPFGIDSNRGAIYVDEMLDFETVTFYEFEIEVYEISSVEMLSGTAMVHIFIIDANDNPPVFASDRYNVSITEEQAAGALVETIMATDGDAGLAGVLTYRLSGAGSERFSVDVNGTIRTTEILDREVADQYYLTLIVMDISNNPLIATTTVIVDVTDINDNCPEFDPSLNYDFVLLEEMVHINFFTPIVVDRDYGTNAQYTFSISDNVNFNVSTDSGALSLINAALDHEAVSNRSLPVLMTACDMGTVPTMMCCNQTINVTLRDRNDNTPQFESNIFEVMVYENITEGSVIVLASAVDIDHGTNAELRYTFVDTDNANPFLIDHMTGEISTVSTLDWESQPFYSIQVRAEDRGTNPQQDNATVNIIVLDVNEFTPSFDSDVINVAVREDVSVNDSITTISASDPDGPSDGEVFYEFEGISPSHFIINRYSGVLTLVTTLDRENLANIMFDIRASDQGNPMLFNIATVNVTILDVNDNCPEFNVTSYSLEIDESTPTGGRVIQISAYDPDDGSNGEIIYTFGPNAPAQFSISSETGLVTVDADNPLDYETNTTFSFTVDATDMGSNPCTTRSQAFAITVTDANDNMCVFSRAVYDETLIETETVSVDTMIITFIATDGDEPGTNNSRVFYYVDQRDDNQLFVLNSTTGELYVPTGSSLDRDRTDINQAPNCRAIYRYRIEGRDQGNPPMSCFADVVLYVQDINDNAPEFETLTDPVRVSESAIIGSLVHVAQANDADCGINGEVVYSIIDGNEMNSFSIGSSSGEIRVNNVLDKELIGEYNLMISAVNVGTSSYNSTTVIRIAVVDHNDNNPICTPSTIELCIYENHSLNTEVTTVNCSDPDSITLGGEADIVSGAGNDVVYGFGGGNINGSFAIDSTTGVITLVRPVDRETTDFYHLTVYAEDTGTPPRRGFTEVIICIQDVDDNCPVFSQVVYNGSVLENAAPGTLVAVRPLLSATDADIGANAEIIYRFYGGPHDQFAVANDTGLVTVIGNDLDRENRSTIIIPLLATENPACDATSNLVVELVDVNDNRPVFVDFPHTTEICEDSSVETELVTITASDLDSGNNAFVTYNLINSDEDFVIDRSTGIVTVNRPLDRERKEQYNITVIATDSGLQPQSSSAVMLVTILDVNDNIPRPDPPNLDTCIQEHSNDSVVVLRLSDNIIDGDLGLNGNLTYEIVGSPPFSVGLEDGIVRPMPPSDQLDREDMIAWVVRFQITDQGGNNSIIKDRSPSSQCTAVTNPSVFIDVRICLEDINDNPPTFDQDSYIIDVPEGTAANAIVFRLVAKDDDAGSNAQIYYTFDTSIPRSGLNVFSIERETGIISTLIIIDELEPSYQFTALATDMGMPSHTTPINVTIRIQDNNDNNPICNQTFYEFNVTENVPSAFVGVVSAYDSDTAGTQLSYSLVQHQSQQSMFDINNMTGVITTNQQLDREQFSTHLITVVVTDSHNESRMGYCTVFVTVEDQNDECPVFLNGSGAQLFVMENSVSNVFVGQVIATDADAGTNAMINYNISAGDPGDNFDIGLNTGQIVTSGTVIDREVTSNFSLAICAMDAGPPLACPNACISITVLVEDACDHDPMFDDLPREVNIVESTVVGASVTTVTASDLDLGENGVIRYSITSGNIDDAFAIAEFSGVVTVANDLDYDAPEATRVYTLEITATDLCSNGARNQTGILTIRLENEDDNPPICPIINPFPYATEEQNVNNFYSYPAMDIDAPPFNDLAYTILPVPTGNVFAINKMTGMINIVRGELLDREMMSIYCETVFVNSTLTCSAEFCVNIADANDNCPMFSTSTIYTSVPEALEAGVVVDTITAVDADIGINARFNYRIVGGTGQGLFSIDSDGEIMTTALLDRENISIYTLLVETVDMGSPQQTCSATVNITVTDVNDNTPYFVNCEGPHLVTENVGFGTTVLDIDADDDDIGENRRISYSFEGNTNEFGPFQINSETGVITAVGEIDREAESYYTVMIYATDHGIPSSRQSFCSIIINITDLNDNIPSLIMDPVIRLCENETVGPPVRDLSDVAVDLDVAPNNVIYYYNPANPNSNCIENFCFNSSTGSLSLIEPLDFETAESHILQIALSNNDTFSINNIQDYRVGDVQVEVCDVNDVAPQFTNTVFTAGISVTTDLGDTIFEVQATDPENGDFGIVWYRSVTPDIRFNISRETGNIVSNQISQGKAGTSYKYEVEAYDNKGKQPSLRTRQVITIWILHDSQRVIITMDVPRDLVLAKQENITSALNGITGYVIVIQKIRLAENDDQTSVDASKTDVIIYGIDPETNTIVDQNTLINIIDNNFVVISNLLAECNIESVRPYPVAQEVTESTFEDQVWLIIIGVLVLLIIFLGLCLLGCCIICRRQRKVLKRNEAVDSYDSTMRQFTTGQTNPLLLMGQWEQGSEMKEIDFNDDDAQSRQERNPLYESKEVVMEIPPPPLSAEPSLHSMAIAEPPPEATKVKITRHGQSTLVTSHRQSYEQETHFTTTTKNDAYDRDSMDSDMLNAILEDSLNQPGNRDSNTIELLAAAASDEEVPNYKDDTALL